MQTTEVQPPTTMEQPKLMFPDAQPRTHPTLKMSALQWEGKKALRLVEAPRPIISEPEDAIVRITTSSICGSDLLLYYNEIAGLKKGDILGHEGVGIIEDIGENVKNFKKGDRVVISSIISCGKCDYCKREMYSLCDCTNPIRDTEDPYCRRTAGLFGHSRLTSAFPGTHAEYVRVPLADNTLLRIPDNVSDEKAIFLSDALPTGWHANELGEVTEGKTVAVWGCGPVGLLTIMTAKLRGATAIIGIDQSEDRLLLAKRVGATRVIDRSKDKNVVQKLLEFVPGGPDSCIDTVGIHYSTGILETIGRAVSLETSPADVLPQAILSCKKGGVISVVGGYTSTINQFPIGPFMEKGLTMRGGQVFVQRYWKQLLQYIENGELDPTVIVTHILPLKQAAEAYEMFDKKDVCKVLLKAEVEVQAPGVQR